jgi:hypothetical protein
VRKHHQFYGDVDYFIASGYTADCRLIEVTGSTAEGARAALEAAISDEGE